MLQALISLSDQEIRQVSGAVRTWCTSRNVDLNSDEGCRALRAAIDLVRAKPDAETLISELTGHLRAMPEGEIGQRSGS
jgi:hypothetical protein